MLRAGQSVIFETGGPEHRGLITKVAGEEISIKTVEGLEFVVHPRRIKQVVAEPTELTCPDCGKEVTVVTNETVLYRYQVEGITIDGTEGEPDWDEPQLEEGLAVNQTWCECGCAECPWEYDHEADAVTRKQGPKELLEGIYDGLSDCSELATEVSGMMFMAPTETYKQISDDVAQAKGALLGLHTLLVIREE